MQSNYSSLNLGSGGWLLSTAIPNADREEWIEDSVRKLGAHLAKEDALKTLLVVLAKKLEALTLAPFLSISTSLQQAAAAWAAAPSSASLTSMRQALSALVKASSTEARPGASVAWFVLYFL
ncbi:hypothetical protein WJX73_007229 [Symbiochloris irregularis]|uniref:Uncharacterized protein n=1 Tax=Symbiochloris irregularis TaxID=706552 RepID=A0AAW1PFC9_9CHLO